MLNAHRIKETPTGTPRGKIKLCRIDLLDNRRRFKVHPRYVNPDYVDWQPNPVLPKMPFGRRVPPGFGRMIGRLTPWGRIAWMAYDIAKHMPMLPAREESLTGYQKVTDCGDFGQSWTYIGVLPDTSWCAFPTPYPTGAPLPTFTEPNIYRVTFMGDYPPFPDWPMYQAEQRWEIIPGETPVYNPPVGPKPLPKRQATNPWTRPAPDPFDPDPDPNPDPDPDPQTKPLPPPYGDPFNPDPKPDPGIPDLPIPAPRFTGPYRTNPFGWPDFREAGNGSPDTENPRRPDYIFPPVVVVIDVPQVGGDPRNPGPGNSGGNPGTQPDTPTKPQSGGPPRIPPRHPTGWGVRAPAGPREKEKKVRAGSGWLRLIGGMLGAFSEGNDLVDVLWEALPRKYRTGRNFYERARDVYDHFEHIDPALALRNFVLNEIQDRAVGRAIGYGNRIRPGLGSDLMRF